eukprot:m.1212471 g.1212471  ORF g.1212471 m.1212471 type:complete len:52 (-) comp24598_c0_seq5:2574-2729(-)
MPLGSLIQSTEETGQQAHDSRARKQLNKWNHAGEFSGTTTLPSESRDEDPC